MMFARQGGMAVTQHKPMPHNAPQRRPPPHDVPTLRKQRRKVSEDRRELSRTAMSMPDMKAVHAVVKALLQKHSAAHAQ